MRKIHTVVVTLLMVLALGVLTASSSFAVTQFLVGGSEVGASSELLVFVKGELLLEDMGSPALASQVLCSGWLDMSILGEAGGAVLGLVLGMLTLSGVETRSLECAGQKTCEGTKNIVTPIHLPWRVELELMAAGAEEYLLVLLLTNEAGEEPGYIVDCNTILGLVEDSCTGETSAVLKNLASTIEVAFTESQQAQNCSVGGAGEGLIEGKDEIVEPIGETISVSEA